MKQDAWLRDAAREHYYRNYLADDADFIRADRNRKPAYLVAADYAHESKRLDAEWNAKQRQILLFNLSDHSKD